MCVIRWKLTLPLTNPLIHAGATSRRRWQITFDIFSVLTKSSKASLNIQRQPTWFTVRRHILEVSSTKHHHRTAADGEMTIFRRIRVYYSHASYVVVLRRFHLQPSSTDRKRRLRSCIIRQSDVLSPVLMPKGEAASTTLELDMVNRS